MPTFGAPRYNDGFGPRSGVRFRQPPTNLSRSYQRVGTAARAESAHKDHAAREGIVMNHKKLLRLAPRSPCCYSCFRNSNGKLMSVISKLTESFERYFGLS
jgi:hypothetical protein